MRKIFPSLLILFFFQNLLAQQNLIGHWLKDEYGLPAFNYTGALPFKAKIKNGQDAKLPSDPWFLLGNYRFTLFAHVSGEYELVTGERAWGRVNQGDRPNSGQNDANINILDSKNRILKTYKLVGKSSLAGQPEKCSRVFGCGFAVYSYEMEDLSCKRSLSVKPSKNPYNGEPAFYLTVEIKNKSAKKIKTSYYESVAAHYQMMQQQHKTGNEKVKYFNKAVFNQPLQIIKVDITALAADPLLFPHDSIISPYDGFPPSLFIKAFSNNVKLINKTEGDKEIITAQADLDLEPGETKKIELIIGYSFKNSFENINQICQSLISSNYSINKYGDDWKKLLPTFGPEKDSTLKNEMTWHAYNLEAMATYNEFYKETEIPQGTVYDYDWGIHASARDHIQHALPLIYYNPAQAKSVLKYIIKKTTPWGEIRLMETGYGLAHAGTYFTSDQQLFFFLLLSEYLRVTKDYNFLNEKVENYPVQNMRPITVLETVENCFTFLRDQIGTGPHGLVRLMNSDWNDAVFYIEKAPYNRVLYSGESHMNTTMVLSFFDELAKQITIGGQGLSPQLQKKAGLLTSGMSFYRKEIYTAFIKDLGNRNFSRRMYFNHKAYGEENMFLEPQGFMLQVPELSAEKKKKLYDEIKERLYKGEKLGAREQEKPEFNDEEFDKGSRENGGFWYSLNGPVIIGVSQFDKAEAIVLLKKMTFNNYAKQFPQYWSSYWSASDNIESSLIPMEGLPDQTNNYADSPVYCAHPHAWLLYCYYKINEK